MSKTITFWPSESCSREQTDAVIADIREHPDVESVTCAQWPTNPAAAMGLYVVMLRDDADIVAVRQVIADVPGIGSMLNADGDPE